MNYTNEQLDKLYSLRQRAQRRNLTVRETEPHHFIVSSHSNPAQPHIVADGLCDCKAAQCKLPCTHIAEVAYESDFMVWLEFELRDKIAFLEARHRVRTGQATRKDKRMVQRGRELLNHCVPETVTA